MALRNYQSQCIDAIIKAVDKGYYRQIVSMPVGSGKTFTFAHLIRNLSPLSNKKTLILAHRMELLLQAAKTCKSILPKANIQIDQGSKRANVNKADIVVASVQSLISPKTMRLNGYDPDDFKLIVVDECHHSVAPSYKKIFTHFGYFNDEKECKIPLIGFTATPSRDDHKQLGEIYEHLTYHKDIVDLIKDGHLCNVSIVSLKSKLIIDAKTNAAKSDFSKMQLQYSVNTKERNNFIVQSYFDHAIDRKSTLVFAVDIEHVTTLVSLFKSRKIDAKGISSKTDLDVRKQIISDFRQQLFPVLINCAILTEGTDIPNIDCLIMARPTLSSVLHQQMLGRGLRNAPNKKDCKVIDVVDGCRDPALTPKRVNLEYAAFEYPTVEGALLPEKKELLPTKDRKIVSAPVELMNDHQWVEFDLLDTLNDRPVFDILDPVRYNDIIKPKPQKEKKVMRKLEFKRKRDAKDLFFAFRTVKYPRLKWNNMYGSVFCVQAPTLLAIISEEDEHLWHMEIADTKKVSLKYSKSFTEIEQAVKYAEAIIFRNLRESSIHFAKKSRFSYGCKAPSKKLQQKLSEMIHSNTDDTIQPILEIETSIDRNMYDTQLLANRLLYWPFYKQRNYPFIANK